VALPRRLLTPRGVRLALRRLLADERFARRARELRDWAAEHDGAAGAAAEVEALAG
jgi:UDP:flavonoid glycosyltransferase YjiC (YdhE family)